LLQLLNPIWLFAIGGIAIPLIIHLWNVKKGKTLKVGSISLLGESSRQSAKSLKLSDLLLLFLRCFLLIILAFILAKPIWESLDKKNIKSGWILIEEENSKEIYDNFKLEIDSLLGLEYEFHFFEPEFRTAKITEVIAENKSNKNNILSYWPLLNLLNDKIPTNTKAFLFTSNRLNRLGSERAIISFPLTWKTINMIDSTSTWIENAWFKESGNIMATIATSSPTATIFTTETFNPAIKNSRLSLEFDKGAAVLNYIDRNKKDSSSILIDTTSIKIAIYTDKFKSDASYIKAAIVAIQNYTARKIELSEFSTKNIPSDQNIVFWLSESGIPNQLKPKNTLFTYKSGDVKNVNSQLKLKQSAPNVNIELYKRINISENEASGFPIWEDGFGNPILYQELTKDYVKLQFYSRFNPDWSELVWSQEFPKALTHIILSNNKSSKIHSLDKRKVNPAQMAPLFLNRSKSFTNKSQSKEKSLENQFWLAFILIFMTERFLTFKKNLI
jgi:hypothetical protein